MTILRAAILLLAVLPARGDEFDSLRLRWRDLIAGGASVDQSLPQVHDRLAAIESSARSNWNSLQKSPSRTALWSDLASTNVSSQITSSWSRLRTMALAWATPGQSLYADPALLDDLRSAMSWMELNRYNARVRSEYDNWWDWEIGTPLQLGDLLVLLYDQLAPDELAKYAAAIDRFDSDPRVMIASTVSTGANRVWKCKGAALRAIVVKDASKLKLAGDSLGPVFAYVTSGDGFYRDGSFIQHTRHPYTGGYGNSLIGELADLMYLLSGSTWSVEDPGAANLYRWVTDSFFPVIWRGAMMDMVRGREISRSGSPDHAIGHTSAAGILRVSQFAPGDAASAMRSRLKQWYLSDTSRDWSSGRTLDQVMRISALLADDTVDPSGELTGSWIFAGMDRVVHRRPAWAFAISMHSSRIYNYESINNENLRAWHTGDGMTYLYTDDLTQFANNFWPTVDPQRLPGTTVVAGSTARQGQTGGSNAAGGATLEGRSAVMFQLHPDGGQLDAKKSWFLFDREGVALGADIRSTASGKTVETVVENRLLTGDPAFTSATDASWAHLEGVAGYIFPDGAVWRHERAERQGSWSQINAGGSSSTIRRTYETVWFDHGTSPAGAAYGYIVLPGATREETESYAAAPDVRVVENSPVAQSVALDSLGLRAANFWTNTSATSAGIASDRVASVVVAEQGGELHVAVADPTQANTGAIHLEIDRAAAALIDTDDTVTVDQLAPTVKLTVNVRNARGASRVVKLSLAQ